MRKLSRVILKANQIKVPILKIFKKNYKKLNLSLTPQKNQETPYCIEEILNIQKLFLEKTHIFIYVTIVDKNP